MPQFSLAAMKRAHALGSVRSGVHRSVGRVSTSAASFAERTSDPAHTQPVSGRVTVRAAIATLNLMERFCSSPRLLVLNRGVPRFRPVSDLDLRLALLHGCPPDSRVGQLRTRAGMPWLETAPERVQPLDQFDRSSVLTVVMAGGDGTRVRPFTASTPKPMLPVHGRPVLEVLLRSLRAVGLRHVVIVVRYRHRAIRHHFAGGRIPDLDISYLREPIPLGTAGALGALRHRLRAAETLLVVNADILTTLSFRSLLRFHFHAGLPATVCVRPYPVSIPFGVPLCEGGRLIGFEEKPVKMFHVNSGIYCLPAPMMAEIPQRSYIDMPTLLQRLLAQRVGIGVFPLVDAYHEIGSVESYRAAPAFYRKHRDTFEAATAG